MTSIIQFPVPIPVTNGNLPQFKFAIFGDNLATVTTAGYLTSAAIASGIALSNADVIMALYSFNIQTQSGTFGIFTVSISSSTGQITLSQWANSGDAVLPTTANYLAHFTNTTGTISSAAGNVIQPGNISAGLAAGGTAGTLASFPATGSKGSLILAAVANTGNTNTTISNAAMGQASVISIPDPAGATADFVIAPAALVNNNLVKASGTAGLVADAGIAASAVATYTGSTVIGNLVKASSTTGQITDAAFALHAATTSAYAGGGTSNAFTTTNMTASSIVTATILTQTNTASIVKAVPGTNTLTVTFSADPGANTTISWISVTPAG
ncbi:MAG TPA: hypothetical protein VGJ00_10275 [Rhabdochlamydiaceae bacterium]|jgi:hypothetical protein